MSKRKKIVPSRKNRADVLSNENSLSDFASASDLDSSSAIDGSMIIDDDDDDIPMPFSASSCRIKVEPNIANEVKTSTVTHTMLEGYGYADNSDPIWKSIDGESWIIARKTALTYADFRSITDSDLVKLDFSCKFLPPPIYEKSPDADPNSDLLVGFGTDKKGSGIWSIDGKRQRFFRLDSNGIQNEVIAWGLELYDQQIPPDDTILEV